jgi:hypothetical protein
MKAIFISANNEAFASRFVPCATGWLLLKTGLATAKRAVMAQKVLFSGRRLEIWPNLSSQRHSGFQRNLMNTMILKRHGVLRGETSRRETQQYKYNLTTKGRNPRQIHE